MNTPGAESIRQALASTSKARLERIEVFPKIESTNSYLLDEAVPRAGRFRVALADYQTAGRGRRDKRWLSPPGSGLCVSIAYTFTRRPDNLPALTLAIGIWVVRTLEGLGIDGAMLKWPNDIVAKERKLGGILTEIRGNDGASVVVGIGLNVDFEAAPPESFEALQVGSIVDLRSLGGTAPDRLRLTASLIDNLVYCMNLYEHEGIEPFQMNWRRYDWLKGKQVRVETSGGFVEGEADGVDSDGALLIAIGNKHQRIISGSVALLQTGDSSA